MLCESIGFFKIDPMDVPILTEETRKRILGIRHQSNSLGCLGGGGHIEKFSIIPIEFGPDEKPQSRSGI